LHLAAQRSGSRPRASSYLSVPFLYMAELLVDWAYAKGNFALLVKAVRRGIPLPFAAIHSHRAFPSVENLTSFILQCLSRADKDFDIFLVADQEQVSMPEFVERLARAAGTSPKLFSMPTPVLAALLRASGRQEAGIVSSAHQNWIFPKPLRRLATADNAPRGLAAGADGACHWCHPPKPAERTDRAAERPQTPRLAATEYRPFLNLH